MFYNMEFRFLFKMIHCQAKPTYIPFKTDHHEHRNTAFQTILPWIYMPLWYFVSKDWTQMDKRLMRFRQCTEKSLKEEINRFHSDWITVINKLNFTEHYTLWITKLNILSISSIVSMNVPIRLTAIGSIS